MVPLKILLVEDELHKKQRLLEAIVGRPDLFAEPATAITVAQALELLQASRYDVLLADLILPRTLGGSPTEENGLELLRITSELDEPFGAAFSLCITRAVLVSAEVEEFFKGLPWGILRYRDDTTDFLGEFLASAEYIQRRIAEHHEKSPTVDALVIAALPEPELAALERLLPWLGPRRPLDNRQAYRLTEISLSDGRKVSLAIAHAERMGPVHAAISVVKLCSALRPRMVLMSGICAGFPSKTKLGDVVAAETAWLWQDGKFAVVDDRGEFQESPHQIHVSPEVKNLLQELKRDAGFWGQFGEQARSAGLMAPSLVIGPMATGAAVLADASIRDSISKHQNRTVAGLDMETYSVYAAAQSCNWVKHFVSLKAVCDVGDKAKGDDHQAYAATVSAACTLSFLQRFLAT
jgi:nucleoside phosphorylase